MIRIEYDKSADAAYIYMREIEPGGVGFTYPCDPVEINGMINLDFDKSGLLIGIEIIDASKKLPIGILENATRIDV